MELRAVPHQEHDATSPLDPEVGEARRDPRRGLGVLTEGHAPGLLTVLPPEGHRVGAAPDGLEEAQRDGLACYPLGHLFVRAHGPPGRHPLRLTATAPVDRVRPARECARYPQAPVENSRAGVEKRAEMGNTGSGPSRGDRWGAARAAFSTPTLLGTFSRSCPC